MGAPARMLWGDLTHPAVPAPAKNTVLDGRVADAVAKVDDAMGRRGGSSARYVPSAGACYPYEALLCTRDLRASAVIDLAKRQLVVREADRFPLEEDEYVCVLVGRPWLSMRKYGARGFLYHLIDGGHALLNLGLLNFGGSSGTVEVSRLHGEALAAGTVTARVPRTLPGWRLVRTSGTVLQTGRSEFEQWAMDLCPDGPPRPVAFDVLDAEVRDLAAEIPRRSSAGEFALPRGDEGRPAGRVAEGVGLARRALESLRLQDPGLHLLDRADIDGDLLNGLAGQEHLASAGAFVVMSTPRADDDSAVGPGLQSLLLAAGAAGQVLYLAATRHGIGVTGVGGIDPAFWNRLIPPGRHAVYLVAFGRHVTAGKHDALSPGSHG